MGRVFSHREARAFYDRFGSKQDLQAFYEDPAVEALSAHSAFDEASHVVEIGCGTGRLAQRLLRDVLPRSARYSGFDVSSTMVGLSEERLRPWHGRARVQRTDGAPAIPIDDASCDRVLSTYVLDLLSQEDIRAVLREARRALVPGGRLCLASLTFGQTPTSRALCRLWTVLHAIRPQIVGGCRPLDLRSFLDTGWRLLHREVVCTLGICSEVVAAEAL